MSTAADRNMSIHDLPKCGFVAVCTNNEDLAKLPVRYQIEVRASKIIALEAIERPTNEIEFGDRHPFGHKQANELKKLREEQRVATSAAEAKTH